MSAISPTYIIFVCKSDPIGLSLPKYTIERGVVEAPGELLETDAHWVVLNASSWDKAEGRLAALLHYIQDGSIENDELVKSIVKSVNERNMDPERKAEMMKYVTGRMLDSELDKAEGAEKAKKLTSLLVADGRIEELRQGLEDDAVWQRLLAEYGLEQKQF